MIETDLGEFIVQIAGQRPSTWLCRRFISISSRLPRSSAATPASRCPLSASSDPLRPAAASRAFCRGRGGHHRRELCRGRERHDRASDQRGKRPATTSLPRIHIAVMGMEKGDSAAGGLARVSKVLARAATGQKLSVYTTMITGPRRPGELDGPEEFHLVILDNGRSRILGGPLRESLFCIRCGACLNACPIYRNVGGHAYGGVYAGPIGAVLTPLYDGLAANHHLPNASSLCGACQAACPVRIAIPEMLIQLREQLHHEPGQLGRMEAMAYRLWAWSMRRPRIYRLLTWLATRTVGRWKCGSGWLKKLPGGLGGWTEKRDFPAAAPERFRDWWQARGSPKLARVPNHACHSEIPGIA